MKAWAFFLLCLAIGAKAYDVDLDSDLAEIQSEPRLFFVNFTSSLVQVNATILAYGLLFLAIAGAAAVALYYLYLESASSSSGGYGGYGYGQNYGYQQYARSANGGYETNWPNILELITLARELYNFEYNDIECQKKLLCDIMREEAIFGTVSANMKKGFKLVRYLENLGMPDDFRELLDEYMDAANMSESQKGCDAYFECPFDAKKTMSAFYGNAL